MFILQAPYPALTTTMVLPTPELSNGEGLTVQVTPYRAQDGTLRTYVKTTGGRRRLSWEFLLTRPQALELRTFLKMFFAEKVRVSDHESRYWLGNFDNNPFELATVRGARPDASTTRGETMTVRLEFQGVEDA